VLSLGPGEAATATTPVQRKTHLKLTMPWVFMIEKLWIFVLLMSRTLFFSLVFRSLNEASLLEGTLHVVEIDSYLLRPELVLLF